MKYLTPDEIRDARDAIYEGRQKGRPLPIKGRCLPIFERYVPDGEARVLEYGPGTGKFLDILAEKGYRHLFGCDINDYISREIKPKLEGFGVLDLCFDRLPWKDSSFDAVCAWGVMEHLENPHYPIREAFRVLRPGGTFFVSLPNIFNIVSRLVFLRRGLLPNYSTKNNHISLFPRGIFEKAVLKYFDLVEEGYVGSGVNLPLLRRVTFFPENEWFGRWVYYVLRKK